MDNSTSDKETAGKSATATAQLKAEAARQSNAAYGDSGTTNSISRNAGTATGQKGPAQG